MVYQNENINEPDSSNLRDGKYINLKGFAEILGVSKMAVSKQFGKRLKKSVAVINGKKMIHVYLGVLEWDANSDHNRSRSDAFKSLGQLKDLPPISESNQVKAYFEARDSKRTDELKEGQAVPLSVAAKKMQRVGKTLRDRLLSVGNAVASEFSPEDADRIRNIVNSEIESALREFCLNRMGLKK